MVEDSEPHAASARLFCDLWGITGMTKFILLSFAFMGVVFYELSGGKDFDPEALRISRMDPVTEQALPKVRVAEATQETAPAPQQPVDTASSAVVTRASFDLNTLDTAEKLAAVQPEVRATAVQPIQEEQTLILPSLVTQAKVETEAVVVDNTAPVTAADIRAVTGNRVNMRGGPGTNFDVVGKLTRGQEVEILSDPGTGWVKLRPMDGGSVGWMADFLLTES